jgi:hypothetical protein
VTAVPIAAALETALALGGEGLPCFPCGNDKRPATSHGFKEATCDSNGLRNLWGCHPAPLVGVATGAASGIDALDLDKKHPAAGAWWAENRDRLPVTRTHRTRSGGLHLLFRHAAGLRCTAGSITPGVDTRGDGGYIVWWPSAALPVLCDAPPAPWPAWLISALTRPHATAPCAAREVSAVPGGYGAQSRYASAALRYATEQVARARIGTRNATLNAKAYGLGRLVAAGLLDPQEVADTLAATAFAAGLGPREIEATLRSALRARGLL